MTTSSGNEPRAEFFALLERACRVGSLIPEHVDEIDLDDPAVRAELKMIVAEFDMALAAIEANLPLP